MDCYDHSLRSVEIFLFILVFGYLLPAILYSDLMLLRLAAVVLNPAAAHEISCKKHPISNKSAVNVHLI